MPEPFKVWDRGAFAESVRRWQPQRKVRRVQIHHTYLPDYARFDALVEKHGVLQACVILQQQMHSFHTKTRGWSDIGQHVSIAPSGHIITGRSWDRSPAGITGWNTGSLMFEAIGDLRKGKNWPIRDEQYETMQCVTSEWLEKFNLDPTDQTVVFHKEHMATACPGDLDKPTFLKDLAAYRDRDEESMADDEPDILELLRAFWEAIT